MGPWGLPTEKFQVYTSVTSQNALLKTRLRLFSSFISILRKKNVLTEVGRRCTPIHKVYKDLLFLHCETACGLQH